MNDHMAMSGGADGGFCSGSGRVMLSGFQTSHEVSRGYYYYDSITTTCHYTNAITLTTTTCQLQRLPPLLVLLFLASIMPVMVLLVRPFVFPS